MNPIKNKKDLQSLIEELRNSAFNYLDKYSVSKQQLRIYLLKKFSKKNDLKVSKDELLNLIDVVIKSLEINKLISDEYYSDSKSKVFLRRGYSLNKIRHSLAKKGIEQKYIKGTISKIEENESNTDFYSALIICNKRKIGPCRAESNREIFYKKDMGVLARSGFSYEVSKKVLSLPKSEFKKFYRLV